MSTELHAFARAARTLAANVMLAAYVVVLWRWCKQDDFVLPCNIAGRQTEYRSAIGYFSYILHLRVRVNGHETFREILHHISNAFFGGLSHQDFGRIALKHTELLSGTLFQWISWHLNEPEEGPAPAGQDTLKPLAERVSLKGLGEGLTLVPPGITAIEVTFFDTAKGICALGTYRTDRFAVETVERFMTELRAAVAHFVRHPDVHISALAEAGSR